MLVYADDPDVLVQVAAAASARLREQGAAVSTLQMVDALRCALEQLPPTAAVKARVCEVVIDVAARDAELSTTADLGRW